MHSLPAAFADAVARHSESIALVDGSGREITFAELNARADRFAATCARRGIGPGDRVLLAMPVGIGLYAALSAIWRIGAVAVFPEPTLGLAGLRHAAKTTRPRAYLSSGWLQWLRFVVPGLFGLPLLKPSAADQGEAPAFTAQPDDPALISFTSGSTGAPKAISRSHGFLMAQHQAVAPLLASAVAERDLVAFPVFVLVNLAQGRTSVLPNWKLSALDRVTAPALIAWIDAQRITRLLLPPALCEILAEARLSGQVTTIFTGGGPVFPDVIARLRSQSPNLRIVTVYGSTEAEPIAELDASEVSEDDWQAMRTGRGLLAGAPVSSIRLKIVDGEIVVSGPHVNRGYLDPAQGRETKIVEDGVVWHRTGDAGRLDNRGRLWLLGRWGETCRTGTGDVYPFAIETAARFWPGVRRAALCQGASHPILAVEADAQYLADCALRAEDFGIKNVRAVTRIPMDRRHRSKVDYGRLRQLLQAD